jgi:hypothetical protein
MSNSKSRQNNTTEHSNHTHPNLYHDNQFIIPFVGGNKHSQMFNKDRYTEQLQVIRDFRNKMPDFLKNQAENNSMNKPLTMNEARKTPPIFNNFPVPDEGRFDPYLSYLDSHGLINADPRNIHQKENVYIDSRFRITQPDIKKGKIIHLQNLNPFNLTEGSRYIKITHTNHKFNIEDKISITGVKGISKTLLMKYMDGITNKTSVEFTNNSNIVKINTPHGLGSSYIDGSVNVIISGIKANTNGTYLDSLPINLINTKHKIYLYRDSNGIPNDSSSFYIKLSRVYNNTDGDIFNPDQYTFKVIFDHVGGIPLNYINADFPVSTLQIQGYHEIVSIDDNSYTIECELPSYCSCNGGGTSVQISKIEILSEGSTSSNSYTITLPRTYHNVIGARITSMSFPITQKAFTTSNNKIYWQNLDDGDHVYSTEINPGNYFPEELIDILHNKFYNTLRINVDSDVNNKFITPYTRNQFVQIGIDSSSDIVSFRSFKESILSQPITGTIPVIPDTAGTESAELLTSNIKLNINHPFHNLNVGSLILIQNAVAHMGIASSYINGEHEIIEIVDENNYLVQLKRFNIQSQRSNTGGGNSVYLYTPNVFRLRFDYPDTIGINLGFRNVGAFTSITKFATEIKNNELYENDIDRDVNGKITTITNNSINLAGYDYIIMTCRELNNSVSVGPVKEIFTKILLTDIPGKTVFNTFIPINSVFVEPIAEISELTFAFYNPDGTLYSTEGLDHSFNLELITLRENPKDTGISAKTGRPINYDNINVVNNLVD